MSVKILRKQGCNKDIDIDIPSHKRDHVFRCLKAYFQSFGSDIIRVSTVKTESSKSAMQTACRGLGINSDIATYLSSLIPIERGSVWSIEDCYYGNKDKGRKPVTELKNQIDQYPGLLETALGVQGLISGRGSHACGVLILDDVTKYNTIMRAPSGELISQWNLGDSEFAGCIKYDLLNTKTMAMIQLTLEMLVAYGHMEWQGSIRATYDKYLHPDVIDKDTPEMWEKLNRGEVLSAFQFETQVGSQALKAIKPRNLIECANANTLMRLMVEGDGAEQPMEMYVRYRNDIEEWYRDMDKFGLTVNEQDVLKEHLLKDDFGVCSTQERMMLMTMDKRIAGFGVVESNVLRKAIAKKKGDIYDKAHTLFYEWGQAHNARKEFLDYVWDVQIALQKGYSFSILHSVGYTWILVQQLNLVHHYPSIYWNTAVLLMESGAVMQEVDEDSTDDRKEKTTNYGVVASAISGMQERGVTISLPDINNADVGFTPHELENSIMFGFKGVSTINNDTAQTIIDNRPYTGLQDFHDRLVAIKREVTLSTGKTQMKSYVSTSQTISLIKAGAFDTLEQQSRHEILEDYLHKLYPPKTKLTAANIAQVMEMGIVPTEYKSMLAIHNFREYVRTLPKRADADSKSITWHVLECYGDADMTDYTTNFFFEHFGELTEGRDYMYDDDGYVEVALKTSRKGSFDSVVKQKIAPFTQWLNSKDCIDTYNNIVFEQIKHDNMSGGQSRWEMESMNYYYSGHELADIDQDFYSIVNFNDLPEEPTITGFTRWNGIDYPKFALARIAGTVLDRDKNKHMVTLLTEYGVVTLKFHSGQFSFYDKTLSMIDDETGKKVTVEESWFKRGNKLLVTGFRRGGQFRPKRYTNSVYQHAVCMIEDMREDGRVILREERARI